LSATAATEAPGCSTSSRIFLVRPIGDQYELVAGERRLRSYVAVFGPESSIPAFVRDMSDEEAKAAALAENVERANMTPVEESEASARVLGDCNGDRAEAAKRLGWSRDTLDKRLALMYASEKVREALQDKKILLGHAELLAGCRKESQDAAVAHLLSLEKAMTVGELKAYLENNAQHLADAIFKKDDCTACHHNSANQALLFAESITTGRCTNKQCFESKTKEELNARAEALKEEFQVVRIVHAGENLTLMPLVGEGPKGVGVDQAKACQTCKDFGAVVSAVPDKLGRVFKSMCMNVQCNKKHVDDRLKAEAAAQAAANAAIARDAVSTESAKGAATAGSNTPGKAKVTDAGKSTPKVASSEPSNRVKEYREKLWRMIFEKAIPKLPVASNRAVLMAICLTRPSVLSSLDLAKAVEGVVKTSSTSGSAAMLKLVTALDQAQLGAALNSIPACVNGGGSPMSIEDITGILKFYDIKVASYWKVGKSFFDLLTKNELDAVCEEIGIKQAMGATYAKARNGSKDEFIAAALAVPDFDYAGRIPKLMSY
jgi:ParB family chromosome partitioning protein